LALDWKLRWWVSHQTAGRSLNISLIYKNRKLSVPKWTYTALVEGKALLGQDEKYTNLPGRGEKPSPARNGSKKAYHEGKEKALAAQAQPIDILPCGIFVLRKVGCYRRVLLLCRCFFRDRHVKTCSVGSLSGLSPLK
jgi:hypothetical protein